MTLVRYCAISILLTAVLAMAAQVAVLLGNWFCSGRCQREVGEERTNKYVLRLQERTWTIIDHPS